MVLVATSIMPTIAPTVLITSMKIEIGVTAVYQPVASAEPFRSDIRCISRARCSEIWTRLRSESMRLNNPAFIGLGENPWPDRQSSNVRGEPCLSHLGLSVAVALLE